VDEREVRAVQAAVGVLLLGAFVFRIPELVYVVTIAVGVGALLGTRAHLLHAAYRAAVGARLKSARAAVPVADVRALDLLATGILVIASLAFVVGIDLIGWVLVLVEAGLAVVEATTGFNAATALVEQLRRDG
jgi:hypothetical protein